MIKKIMVKKSKTEHKIKKMRIGSIKKKIILILQAGLALGLNHSPTRHFKILSQIPKEWRKINDQVLKNTIRSLYQSKLIEAKRNNNGSITMILNEDGQKTALCFNIDKIKIKKPEIWDKKWRIVIFDIPEESRHLRDSLRKHFRDLGFIELQKSVMVHPYPCEKEIEFLVELYKARKYVRFILADQIDNDLHIRSKFNLL